MATMEAVREERHGRRVAPGGQRLLVVDDDDALRQSLTRVLEQSGYEVLTAASGQEARAVLNEKDVAVVLLDLVLPDVEDLELLHDVKSMQPDAEVLVVTAFGSIEGAVEAMRQGAYNYLTKPFRAGELLATVAKALERAALQRENRWLRLQVSAQAVDRILVGHSLAMQKVKRLVEQVAPSTAPVIIEGESGTGKELVAEALHRASPRASKPLVKLSCAALPETLLEAELFGYERGAFTGAVSRKPGRFDLANGGTLFLDEIVDIPLTTQVKLLRVLQDGTYERLGGRETLRSDARILAATNRNLEQAVRDGKFREDLFYRLNVIGIKLPPLRDRRDEIPLLAHHFRKLYAARNQKDIRDISPAAMSCLVAYDWPGNVRELENVIERAVVLCDGPTLLPHLLPEALNPTAARGPARERPEAERSPIVTLTFPLGTSMRQIQDLAIAAVLEHTQGRRMLAASLLGIHPRTIARHRHDLREEM
ncbi:MAG TPA: sigma-54 dependent transcriptional regulator [Candidatus Xenobia bacterium]|nr:sigma-54 dependent transcriptional regulator [Candidatus Xenobia bacterium]